MPVRRVYEESDWLRVIELAEGGFGRDAIASGTRIPAATVRKWLSLYQREGIRAWSTGVSTPTVYSFETKLAAVMAFRAGILKEEVLAKYSIRNMSQLEVWITRFRDGGEDALRPRTPGRKAPDPSASESVEAKIARLEMENAALKKLQALVADVRRPSSK